MSQEIDAAWVWEHIPPRIQETHKGSYGHAMLVAGSVYYRGAAVLATEGALRTGAGLVTLAAIEPVVQAVSMRLPACCFLPCEQGSVGIAAQESARILQKAQKCTVLLMGPGMTNTLDTAALVQAIVPNTACATVLDADALNTAALAMQMGKPLPHPKEGKPLIITPHPGEMSRLTGLPVAQIEADREAVAVWFAREQECTVVLKGHRTVVATPEERVYINTSGNAGLARGGSGDALAGMLAGLLACGLPAGDAAACAVWLHGAAADRTATRKGQYGMLPSDLFDDLGRLFAENGR